MSITIAKGYIQSLSKYNTSFDKKTKRVAFVKNLIVMFYFKALN